MQVVVEEEAWFAILYGSLVLSTKTGALMFRKDDLSLSCFLSSSTTSDSLKLRNLYLSYDSKQCSRRHFVISAALSSVYLVGYK